MASIRSLFLPFSTLYRHKNIFKLPASLDKSKQKQKSNSSKIDIRPIPELSSTTLSDTLSSPHWKTTTTKGNNNVDGKYFGLNKRLYITILNEMTINSSLFLHRLDNLSIAQLLVGYKVAFMEDWREENQI